MMNGLPSLNDDDQLMPKSPNVLLLVLHYHNRSPCARRQTLLVHELKVMLGIFPIKLYTFA